MNSLESLKTGRQYRFNFTHKRGVKGIVCEVDYQRKRFVIYNYATAEYEGIVSERLVSAEAI